jgi:hypothetical protein
MRFYRGIAISADRVSNVIEDIRGRGLLPSDGSWRMDFNDLEPQLAELRQRPLVTTADTKFKPDKGKPSWAYACSDEIGATYYAATHNRTKDHDVPILISFDANLRDVIIDGRDFLYTLFQLGDPGRARPIAERVYGRHILQYLDRAWATADGNQRIAMCDLATQDDDVIIVHATNKAVIGGRHGTRFRTAFMVQTPVPAARIISVAVIEGHTPVPDAEITLQMVLAI